MWPFAPDPLAWSSGELLVAASAAITLIAMSIAALKANSGERRQTLEQEMDEVAKARDAELSGDDLVAESERVCAEIDELLDEAGHDA